MLKPRQFIPVLIVAAGIVAYFNSFRGPFILDDTISIVDNPHIRHLWPVWEALSPSPQSLVGGRPVVNFSLAINYALGGLTVWWYHALNLAIHLLAGLTLYGIVRRTLLRRECWPSSLRQRAGGAMECWARFGASADWIALTVALIWELHPLQTECVDYIVQRTESLMGLSLLLTVYCTLRGSRSACAWE